LKVLPKEISSRCVCLQPPLMKEKVVYIVRENQLLKFGSASSQETHKGDRLAEVDIAVVIAVD
jgi:hypothetical protein